MNVLLISLYALFLYSIHWLVNTPSVNLPESRNTDFFKPSKFFLLLVAFEIPFAFTVNSDPELIPFYALKHIKDFDQVFLQHFFNGFIFVSTVIIASVFTNPKIGILGKILETRLTDIKSLFVAHILLLVVTGISFIIFLESIGGLYFLLLNIDSKTTLIAGTGYLQAAYNISGAMSMGFLVMSYSKKEHITLFNLLYVAFILILIFLIFSAIGSRKGPILFVIYFLLLWHYNINKLRFFTLRNITVGFIGLLYFSALPLFRTAGSFEFYMSNTPQLFQDSFENMGLFFQRFSELERSLMIYSLFDSSNLWLGSSFIDILYAPIPRSLFPDKPPVDEGVYLYNIAHGNLVSPSTPLRKMMAVGWPPSTITNMYINFWYFGVGIGGLIYGYVLKYFYNFAKAQKFDAISVYLYTNVVFGTFALTNRNIVGFATTILFTFIILKTISLVANLRT